MALVFFVVYSTTDKSLDPWVSRESNNPCIMDSFYDSHDLWHLGASFGLMILAMVVNTMSKPCRECYLVYLANAKKAVAKEKERFSSKAPAPEQAVSDV
ncbi:hypothetical protein ACHWQZ_G018955 [Mnemiopsis leidyi]